MREDRIDISGTSSSVGLTHRGAASLLTVVGLALFLEGCASSGPATRPLATPVPRLEADLLEATRPSEPTILVFAWRLNERGSRIEGRGVARVEPPYRVRLDLFTENGETAATAALVESDLRVPPDVDHRLIPPPALLWASLGVLHPDSGAELLGGEALETGAAGEERTRLRYGVSDGQEARFVFRGEVLESARLMEDGYVVERVELERAEGNAVGPYPAGAVYRDRSAFRELRVTLESREPADSFSPDIWLAQW